MPVGRYYELELAAWIHTQSVQIGQSGGFAGFPFEAGIHHNPVAVAEMHGGAFAEAWAEEREFYLIRPRREARISCRWRRGCQRRWRFS